MGRFIAACLLVVFAALAATDAFACPDGCQSASSPFAADRCNASGTCVFCTGGALLGSADVAVTRLTPAPPVPELSTVAPSHTPANVLDHPPRTA